MSEEEVVVVTSGDNDDPRGRVIDDDYIHSRVTLASPSEEYAGPAEDDFSQEIEAFKKYSGVDNASKQRIYRQIKKGYTGSNGAKSKQHEGEPLDGYSLFGVVTPPYNLDYLSQLYFKSEPHYAAVNAKVSNVVGLGFDFIDSHKAIAKIEESDSTEKKRANQRKMSALRAKMFDWLDDCNDEDEFDETMKKVFTDYEATGNGYFEIGRDIDGAVAYIGHIPAKTMRVRRARDGYVQIIGERVRFFRNFGDTETTNPIDRDEDKDSNEVIHIKKYSPTNSFYGAPDIVAALGAVAGDEFASRYNLDYFDSKAVPRYMVIVKGGKLGAGAHNDLVRFFDSAVKGTNHRTIIIPMPADSSGEKTGIEMKPIEAGVQDQSFTNYDKTNLRKILMVERVPMTKVGLAEGVNLAVARDADKTFKEQVCRPEQRVLEKKLGKVFKERTDLLRFKLNELTLTDEDTQSKIDERYLRMKTIVPNEVRAGWGKTGLKGGDEVVDLKADAASEAAAQGNRERDSRRSAGATDSAGEGRNPKGEGRTAE